MTFLNLINMIGGGLFEPASLSLTQTLCAATESQESRRQRFDRQKDWAIEHHFISATGEIDQISNGQFTQGVVRALSDISPTEVENSIPFAEALFTSDMTGADKMRVIYRVAQVSEEKRVTLVRGAQLLMNDIDGYLRGFMIRGLRGLSEGEMISINAAAMRLFKDGMMGKNKYRILTDLIDLISEKRVTVDGLNSIIDRAVEQLAENERGDIVDYDLWTEYVISLLHS